MVAAIRTGLATYVDDLDKLFSYLFGIKVLYKKYCLCFCLFLYILCTGVGCSSG